MLLRLALLRPAELALRLWQAARWRLWLVVGLLLLQELTVLWPERLALPQREAASLLLLQAAEPLLRRPLVGCTQPALLPQQAARGTDPAVAPKQALQ